MDQEGKDLLAKIEVAITESTSEMNSLVEELNTQLNQIDTLTEKTMSKRRAHCQVLPMLSNIMHTPTHLLVL